MKKILAFLKDTGEKIQNTHPFMQISSFLACVFLFALMGIGFLFIPDTTRAVFFFPDTRTGRIHTEIRYLPEAKGRDARLTRYVEDLVLGTGLENCIPLFNRGTRLLGCFVRGADAYVNLSADALMPVPGTAPSDQACAIFKKMFLQISEILIRYTCTLTG